MEHGLHCHGYTNQSLHEVRNMNYIVYTLENRIQCMQSPWDPATILRYDQQYLLSTFVQMTKIFSNLDNYARCIIFVIGYRVVIGN